MTYDSPLARRHRRRNRLVFIGDYVFFGLGLTLASTTTTLPAFAATLTKSSVLIGAVSAVWTGGWLLPQVLAVPFLANRPRMYRVLMGAQIVSRPAFALFVGWLLLDGARHPQLTLGLFLLMLAYFAMADAVVALAWFDIFARTTPPAERGRAVGASQLLMGVGAFGVGALIERMLGPHGPGYPMNYVVIFGLAAICYLLSMATAALIVEPPENAAAGGPQTLRGTLPHLLDVLRNDPAFARLTVVRLLAGVGGLAIPFYVLHATEVLGLPPSTIGYFASATTVGTAVAGLVLGTVADRLGIHRVVQVTAWVGFCVPVLALLMPAASLRPAVAWLYPVLFALLRLAEGSVVLGFLNYVLGIARPGMRPAYMGLSNTLSGLLLLMPLIGGWLLERTSYPVVFGLTAAGTLAGALAALRLPPTPTAPPEAAPVETVVS